MGVLAIRGTSFHRSSADLRQNSSRTLILLSSAAVLYAAVVLFAIAHHEPWVDEAQSWLLARDAGLVELWTKLTHYEGSPGLWQTLLHILIGLGLPYGGLGLVSAVLGCASICVLLLRAPFPLALRMVLPFTFFLCYQYAVIARSYSLLPLLLFVCALLCRDRTGYFGMLTLVLSLMAAVSVHGLMLSASIWVAVVLPAAWRWRALEPAVRKKILMCGVLYAAAVVLVIRCAWPLPDGVFVTRPNLSMEHLAEASGNMLSGAFTGEIYSSALAVALSLPFLWRGRGLAVFVLSGTLLCAVAGLIYVQVWHHGLLFLAWLFSLWIAANRTRPTPLVLAALAIVAAPQCWWTVQSVRYDRKYPYSGSQEVAQYLRRTHLAQFGIYAIGYACTGVQPYFSRNLFANINDGSPRAYWDWSRRNHVNLDSEHLNVLRPAYVLVGYKGSLERDLWTGYVKQAGYQPVRHFAGDLFWKTRILEPEAFDLYRRGDIEP